MRRFAVAFLALAGCGGGVARLTPSHPRAPCGVDTIWADGACRPHRGVAEVLEEANALLKLLHVEEAIAMLEEAIAAGPYHRDELTALYATLGIAHSYVDHEEEAMRVFSTLLALDQSYVIRYDISAKAAGNFEEVREAARTATRPTLDVSWPRDLEVSRPVPVDIAVFSDPGKFLSAATLHSRRKGTTDQVSFDVKLKPGGAFSRIVLPAPDTERPEVLQLWATGLDAKGNEVLLWGDPSQPRELPLRYDAPTPWYRKWWVWAIAGGAAAVTVGVLAIDPPDFVGGPVEPP